MTQSLASSPAAELMDAGKIAVGDRIHAVDGKFCSNPEDFVSQSAFGGTRGKPPWSFTQHFMPLNRVPFIGSPRMGCGRTANVKSDR